MSDSPDTKAPYLPVGPDSPGAAIVVTAYVLAITSVVNTAVRLVEVCTKKRSFNFADALIILASAVRVTMNLSIITANLPAMKRFLYDLQTGQSGTRLTERHVTEYELSSKSKTWGLSNNVRSGGGRSKNGSSRHLERAQVPRKAPAKEADAQSEGGSEIGILRVVDVTQEVEERRVS
ncbi:hypothetical protein LTR85_007284 [Meristemomyces frigidus]|nr:hypothetical protein LTR85_007284 [Meristemomyces frigidus]